jgi:pimeloyl-ACP methyl ester carboxylesterase
VLPALSRDRRVIAFDHRGTGPLADDAARDSIPEMAADVRAELDERVDVVGFSMGGYVALTLALAEPELVRSLILAGTGAGGPDRVPRPAYVARAFEEAFGLAPEEFGRRTMPYTFSAGWAEQSPDRFEEVLAARLERPTPYPAIEAHVRACYAFYASSFPAERIDEPALIIHGDEDLIVPVENGRRLAERLPDAEYVELPGRGHNLMLEDPDTFAGLVRGFLEGS